MNGGFYYSGAGTNFTGGAFGAFQQFFQQRQVTPEVRRVMDRANTDPVVNAWCRMNNITDAFEIYDRLVEHGKAEYLKRLRVLTKEEFTKLDAENPQGLRSTDPPYETRRCRTHESGSGRYHDFDCAYVVHNDGKCLYQCRCGLVMVNAHPRSLGEDYTHHWAGNGPPGRAADRGPMPDPAAYETWKVPVVVCEAVDDKTFAVPSAMNDEAKANEPRERRGKTVGEMILDGDFNASCA